jgi:hypothetical protein
MAASLSTRSRFPARHRNPPAFGFERFVKRKFPGDFDNLQQVMSVIGIRGEWRKRENHHQYRAATGAVLNWCESTETITFQGPTSAAKDLETAFLNVTAVCEKKPTAVNAEQGLPQPTVRRQDLRAKCSPQAMVEKSHSFGTFDAKSGSVRS